VARKHTKAKVAIYIPSHVFYANISEWDWDYEIRGVKAYFEGAKSH
jgi:hypothetical protein